LGDALRVLHSNHDDDDNDDDYDDCNWIAVYNGKIVMRVLPIAYTSVVSFHEKQRLKLNDNMFYLQEGANPSTSRKVLFSDNYAACHHLVLYYQMVSWHLFLLICFSVWTYCGEELCFIWPIMDA